MITLTICPLCKEQVGVPEATHETARVRCPRCEEEFSLGDAVPDDVAEVTVVDPGAGPIAVKPDDDKSESASSEQTSVEGAQEGFPGFGFDAGSASTATGSASSATGGESRPKKKRKGPGLVGNIVGVVVFGIVGLGIGYGILMWIAPERATPINNFFTSLLPAGASDGIQDASDDFVIGGQLENKTKANHVNLPLFSTLLDNDSIDQGMLFEATADQLSSSITAAAAAVDADQFDLVAAYVAMCKAGHEMTYLVRGEKAEEMHGKAADVMRDFAVPKRKKDIANAIHHWLNSPRPKEFENLEGIFLIGNVKRVGPCGDVFCSEIQFKKTGRLLVISNARPEYNEGDQAAIMGSLVRDPKSRYPGINKLSDALDKFEASKSTIMLGAFGVKL